MVRRKEAAANMSPKARLQEWLEDRTLSQFALADFVFHENGAHLARWLRARGSDFRDPFFMSTVDRMVERERKRAFITTGLDAVLRHGARSKRVYPTGFIFHVGRCGSTLLSNMLKRDVHNFVLSEPYLPLGAMLRCPHRFSHEELRELTRASIMTLGGLAPKRSTRFFVKFFNGYVQALPLIREAIPSVPEVFLYRDPIEVAMSMISTPTEPWLWNEFMTGLPFSAAIERSVPELAARVVGRMLSSMVENVRNETMLVNYSQVGRHSQGNTDALCYRL